MPMELWSALKDDHRNIASILREMEGRRELRAGLVAELKHELEAHIRGEEEALYPPLRRIPGFEELILQAQEQHRRMLTLAGAIEDATEAEWAGRLAELRALLHDYVEEEEDKIIDYGRGELPAHTVEHVKHEYIAIKKALFEEWGARSRALT